MSLTLGLIRDLPTQVERMDDRLVRDRQASLLIQRLLSLSSDLLYKLITRHAKTQLGLIHGFRIILSLERCASRTEYEAVALDFAHEVIKRGSSTDLQELCQLVSSGSQSASYGARPFRLATVIQFPPRPGALSRD